MEPLNFFSLLSELLLSGAFEELVFLLLPVIKLHVDQSEHATNSTLPLLYLCIVKTPHRIHHTL